MARVARRGRRSCDKRIAFFVDRHRHSSKAKGQPTCLVAAAAPFSSLYQAVRLPVKGNEPNEPALTLPDSLSPSTAPVKSRVMGMGEEILADQLRLLPSTLPFSSGPEPWAAACVPVSVPPPAPRS